MTAISLGAQQGTMGEGVLHACSTDPAIPVRQGEAREGNRRKRPERVSPTS